MVTAMKLYEGRGAATNLVRSYDAEAIVLPSGRQPLPLLLTATLVEGLEGRTLELLTERDSQRIVSLAPRLVLVGSGAGLPHVPSPLRRSMETRGIAIEAMQLGAACRTFNVLVQEDRPVLALLLG
jgi:uncharacterized protein